MKQVAGTAMRMKHQRKLKHGQFLFLLNHFFLFIYHLFNGPVNSTDYTGSKCTMIKE
jgi:hypothetical protein